MERIGVIGGGVIGLTTSIVLEKYFDGKYDVSLIEKEENFGSKSTKAAGCGMRTVYNHPTNVELARKGLQFWSNSETILDDSIGFRRNGYLFLTDSSDKRKQLASLKKKQHSYGISAETESPPVSSRNLPNLNNDNYSFSLFSPDAALASPEKIVDTLVDKLEDSTVNLFTGTEVTGIENTEESIILNTYEEDFCFDFVINATGPWANKIARMNNFELPIRNSRRRLTQLDLEISQDAPLTVDVDTGVYILPTLDGKVLAGGHLLQSDEEYDEDNPESFTNSQSKEWNKNFFEKSGKLIDSLSGASVERSWTGLYTMTESRVPIIDKQQNMIHATGFSGHGIMQAPGAAMLISRMLSENKSYTDMFSTLSASRDEPDIDLQF